MCIIVVKDKLHNLPREDYLKNCFDNNSDGAGFMYVDNGKVIIDKGYMEYKHFIKHYKKLCAKYNNFENKSLVMHFRIGTAGANSQENTHPYPITTNKDILHKRYYETDLGMAHNGIISQYNPPQEDKTINDTQNFIIKYVAPLYKNYKDFYKNTYIMDGLEDITSSKLAFLDKYDNIYLVGDFVSDTDGIKYSNSNYLPYTKYYTSNYYGTNYKDRYYDYYKYYDEYKHCDDYLHDNYLYDDDDDLYLPAKKDTDFVDDLKKIPAYDNEVVLKSEWYISINEKPLESVGDKNYIYDYYYGLLYEINENGDYCYLSDDVMIFDENGEELLF